jgi:hypothetical protein
LITKSRFTFSWYQSKSACTEPVAPPANVTQPAQKASNPPETSLGGLGFPVAVVYAIALGATVALVAVGYFIHRGRRGKGKLAVVS